MRVSRATRTEGREEGPASVVAEAMDVGREDDARREGGARGDARDAGERLFLWSPPLMSHESSNSHVPTHSGAAAASSIFASPSASVASWPAPRARSAFSAARSVASASPDASMTSGNDLDACSP